MSSPPRPRPRNRHSAREALCWLVAALVVHGCGAPAPRPAAPEAMTRTDPAGVLARNEEFAIVVTRPGDDLATLARQFLGNPQLGWRISEYNDVTEIRPGQTLVIPLRSHNPIGVHVDGYQTVPILCYHRFGPRASKLTVTPAAFAAQMDYLARNGYHVVPLTRLPGFLAGNEPLPRKSVVITIDDGYRATSDIAFPILKKHGFPATVFLYSDFVGASDALTFTQMKELLASGLIDIQPHSKTHTNLTLRLPDESEVKYRERLRQEVDVPIGVIHDRLAHASIAYAYPYGDVNEPVVDLLARRGVALGLTVTPGGNGFFAYPYLLRRTMVFGNEDLDSFKAKLVTFVRTPGK